MSKYPTVEKAVEAFIVGQKAANIEVEDIDTAHLFAALWNVGISDLADVTVKKRTVGTAISFDVHFRWHIFRCIIRGAPKQPYQIIQPIYLPWVYMLLNNWKVLAPRLTKSHPDYLRLGKNPDVDFNLVDKNIDDIEVIGAGDECSSINFLILWRGYVSCSRRLPNGVEEVTNELGKMKLFQRPKSFIERLAEHLCGTITSIGGEPHVLIEKHWSFPTPAENQITHHRASFIFEENQITHSRASFIFENREVNDLVHWGKLRVIIYASAVDDDDLVHLAGHKKLLAESPVFSHVVDYSIDSQAIYLNTAHFEAYVELIQAIKNRIAANRAA